jgi:hypothetical protein
LPSLLTAPLIFAGPFQNQTKHSLPKINGT